MLNAADLLRQGRNRELWDMCCGYLRMSLPEFMAVQHRLMEDQLRRLNECEFGRRIMGGRSPETIDEFRRSVPLTTYQDYCPELLEKREDALPVKPHLWAHSSGWSGDYAYKWVPITDAFAVELSKVLFGVGILSGARDWNDTSHLPKHINILYSVAPVPYISGIFADVLRLQFPLHYLPALEESQDMEFEERIKTGFDQAISEGFDYFFGLSLVLVNVSEKLRTSSNSTGLRPLLKRPRALWRLGKGKLKSRLAGRAMLPRDLWNVRGIIGSGTDSFVYKDRIKEAWGRRPLDLYACTEGGVIATQTWDYDGMTFVPNLNFLEFIPEEEQLKNYLDRSYQPKTLLLDEVRAGESYEIVITGFHGGVMTRYRIGDMIRITSLGNKTLGIDIPQMAFERRVDDFIDLYVYRFTEKSIWQAIETSGVPYQDWVAYKDVGQQVLNIGIELKETDRHDTKHIAETIYANLVAAAGGNNGSSKQDLLSDMSEFGIKVELLPSGTFAGYIARKQSEGADLAHLKPPHVNPSEKVRAILTADTQETIVVTRSGPGDGGRSHEAGMTV